jgi:GT2 family glycosyltransferase
MDISIIIVNYKTAGLVTNCLKTICDETKDIRYEIIVVDNASGDDSQAIVQQAYPTVRWIQMSYNSGFARANNEAIRQSYGEVVLLINSDTLVEEKAIERCYCNFIISEYTACGVQLLNADRTPQISGNYFMKGGLNYLLPLPYTGNFIKWLGDLAKVKKPNLPDSNSTMEVDWINGAFLMVKKSAIAKVGLMDEDFFLYAEEAEWCSRLKKVGKLAIFGAIKVVHLQGETANKTFGSSGKGYYNLFDRKGLQIMLSNFVRIRKQFGTGWFLVILLFYLVTIPVFFIGMILGKLFGGKKRAYSFKQFKGYCKNMLAMLRLTPAIIKNKPYFYKVL